MEITMERNRCGKCDTTARDYGPEPFIFNINQAAKRNRNFRETVWTGENLQLTLMSIPCGGEIGLEQHRCADQFICIVSGRANVKMGKCKCDIDRGQCVEQGCAVLIPAGTWHNITNIGNTPLCLYSVYAPPQHSRGTVNKTKIDADCSEK